MTQEINMTMTPMACVITIQTEQIMVIRPENPDAAWCIVTSDGMATYFDGPDRDDNCEAFIDKWIDQQFDRLDDRLPILFTEEIKSA